MALDGVMIRGAVYIIDAQKYNIKDRETKFVICLQDGKITKFYNSFTAIFINTNSAQKSKDPRHYINKCDVHIPPDICGFEYGAIAKCGQIFTINIDDVKKHAYTLPKNIMDEIDEKLLLGVGIVKYENL